ncbi:MAG: hypothetical protein FJZ01_27790 [Candidatus Sericytochromatia bacterium]|nr:hypothetical protein [Candidatus Tanganyikabacteria bacterium]
MHAELATVSPAVTADRIVLKAERLGPADVEILEATRNGNRATVHRLKMRIPRKELVRFLAATIAGGPVTDMAVKPLGRHRLNLSATAFGFPTRAVLGLGAAGGRARMTIESANLGWLAVSPGFLRDQIIASSEPAVIESGDVRPDGRAALSFAPGYLFAHVVARLPFALLERGLPPNLDLRLTDIALHGPSVRVEGGQ